MNRIAFATMIPVCLLSACLDRADVERTLGPESPGNTYPELLPSDQLLSLEPVDAEETEALVKELRQRAKSLRRNMRGTRSDLELATELDTRAEALRARADELQP